ncbi:MAG: hypothetical protein ABSB00_00150 [Minisyncoccia bacterium]|jgi:hypothetical protein
MKSLERRFNNIAEKNPNRSSYICFAEAVKGQGFSEQIIHRWFNKLVDKDDYAKKEKKAVLKFLVGLSNPVRTTGNESKSAPRSRQNAK